MLRRVTKALFGRILQDIFEQFDKDPSRHFMARSESETSRKIC